MKKKPFENTVGKEKMPVTSIFSFSHNVFYCSGNNFQFFSHIYLVVCKFFQFGPVLKEWFGKGSIVIKSKLFFGGKKTTQIIVLLGQPMSRNHCNLYNKRTISPISQCFCIRYLYLHLSTFLTPYLYLLLNWKV